jgi:probable F420-dependent oxidoreductase
MYPVPFANAQDLVSIAKYAEELGYYAVMGNDHMTTQAYVREEFSTPPNYWEVLVTLAAIAAETTKIRLATGVLVPAMRRDIVVMAKQIATLDQFSGGRVILGMGIGAYREEYSALQPGRKVHRGILLEECIQALRLLFTERTASWQGEYYHFEDVEMFPKPVQDPLPFFIGGNNSKALERAAQFGQGWLGAGMPVDQMAAAVVRLKELVEQAGRDWQSIEVAPQFVACVGGTYEAARDRYQNSQMYKHLLSLSGTSFKDQVKNGGGFEEMDLVGTADDIIEKLKKYEEAGVNHAAGILFPASSMGELRDQMQMFAEGVIAHY